MPVRAPARPRSALGKAWAGPFLRVGARSGGGVVEAAPGVGQFGGQGVAGFGVGQVDAVGAVGEVDDVVGGDACAAVDDGVAGGAHGDAVAAGCGEAFADLVEHRVRCPLWWSGGGRGGGGRSAGPRGGGGLEDLVPVVGEHCGVVGEGPRAALVGGDGGGGGGCCGGHGGFLPGMVRGRWVLVVLGTVPPWGGRGGTGRGQEPWCSGRSGRGGGGAAPGAVSSRSPRAVRGGGATRPRSRCGQRP